MLLPCAHSLCSYRIWRIDRNKVKQLAFSSVEFSVLLLWEAILESRALTRFSPRWKYSKRLYLKWFVEESASSSPWRNRIARTGITLRIFRRLSIRVFRRNRNTYGIDHVFLVEFLKKDCVLIFKALKKQLVNSDFILQVHNLEIKFLNLFVETWFLLFAKFKLQLQTLRFFVVAYFILVVGNCVESYSLAARPGENGL